MRTAAFLETLAQDLRHGGRVLRRNPAFTCIATLTLALGIGANAAIFSVVSAVLLRPLPWSEPDRAITIWSRWTAFDKTWVASGEVADYRRRARTLQSVAAWSDGQVNITGDGEPERVAAAQVTANTFSTLGVSPALGRVFSPEEDVPNGADLVVLGHGLWRRRYASDPGILQRAIQINGRPAQVVGVMPPDFVLPTDFQNPEPTELWTPLQLDPATMDHGSHGLYAAARLTPGATVEQAAAELHAIARQMTAEGLYPVQMQFDTVVLSLADEVIGGVRRTVLLLLGAVGFLLLIACANVANLLLARAEGRQGEIALRSALGASPGRIGRQLLTEGMVLTFVSTAVGLVLAFSATRALAWWNPANIPRVAGVSIDARVIAFTAAIAVLTTLLFSVAPALRALRPGVSGALKDGGHGSSSSAARQRFRDALVVVEMALAVVLLVGAGLMLRTLSSLQHVPLGFDPSGVLTLRVSLPQAGYDRPEQVVAFYQRLLERVRRLPGVEAAGAARSLPLASTIGDFGLQVEGYVPPAGTQAKGDWQIVTDGYMASIGERLVRGRDITQSDTVESPLVGLVNEEMARRYWNGRDPIGRRFKIGRAPERPWITVVGITADVRHNSLTAPVKEKFYVPHTQWHRSVGNPIRGMSLVVRAAGDPLALARPVREEIRALDASLAVADVRTMSDVVGAVLSTPRFTGALLGLFAALALALSAIGIYGVLSYVVSRRTREIGIRLAIGAGRGQVLAMILRNGLLLSWTGVAVGLAAAAAVTRVMASLLHGVAPIDLATYVAAGASLSIVAVLASLAPAWRAMRVDPVVALKAE